MGIKIGNDWTPSCDYGSEFKNEFDNMKNIITETIQDLNKYKKTIDDNSNNTKITEKSIDTVDSMIRKLEISRSSLDLAKSSIQQYNYTRS